MKDRTRTRTRRCPRKTSTDQVYVLAMFAVLAAGACHHRTKKPPRHDPPIARRTPALMRFIRDRCGDTKPKLSKHSGFAARRSQAMASGDTFETYGCHFGRYKAQDLVAIFLQESDALLSLDVDESPAAIKNLLAILGRGGLPTDCAVAVRHWMAEGHWPTLGYRSLEKEGRAGPIGCEMFFSDWGSENQPEHLGLSLTSFQLDR